MRTPLRITFRHMEPSVAVEARVREHVEHLERFHPEILACHAIVQAPTHQHPRAPFEVHVELAVHGKEVYARCDADRETYSDVYIALRDAFDAAKRLLRNHTTQQHSEAKETPGAQLGTVEHLADGAGRIAADDGHRVHFQRSNVHGASFEDLSVGSIVEFQEERGQGGSQAAAVRPWRGSAQAMVR